MINLIRGPPKNPRWKIEARASNCADTVSNFTFQTFVLASATAGTTVSATNTAAGSQIGKFVNENFYWLIKSYLEFL